MFIGASLGFLCTIGLYTADLYAEEIQPDVVNEESIQSDINQENQDAGNPIDEEMIHSDVDAENQDADDPVGEEDIQTDPELSIVAHVANEGWKEPVKDNEIAGTVGRDLGMEAVIIDFVDDSLEGDIEYRSHIAQIGWEKQWTTEMTGTTGKGLSMEAVEIRLTGEISNQYDIYYRSHIANIGWTGWTSNGKATGSQGYGYSLQALQVQLLRKGTPGLEDNQTAFYGNQLTVQTHVSNIGWMPPVNENMTAGTTGRSLAVEALNMNTSNMIYEGDIQCSVYVQGLGWQDYVSSGNIAGTVGQSRRVEAVRMFLTGEMADAYDLYYQSHVSNIGWLDWASNGESSGSLGYNYRLEALKVQLVEKGKIIDFPIDDYFRSEGLSYTTHVSNIGWQSPVKDGELAGTTGISQSIEAIQISLGNLSDLGGIEYQTHISTIGWESDWSRNGEVSGTVGRSLAIEAIRIALTGHISEMYDIYYRTFISNFGWLDWTANGKTSGSEGLSKSIEAIEITLDLKKTENSRNTISHLMNTDGVIYVDDKGEPLNGWQITNDEMQHYVNVDSSLNLAAQYNEHGIPSLYIDLVTINQNTLDSGLKSTKYPGQSVSVFDKNHEEYCISAGNVEIKGRGNSTWSIPPKKPYQIKFDTKTSILGMSPAKKWVLLANYFDETGLRNAIASDLADAMELDTFQYAFADLYIGGSYRGNYLITQKIDIGKNMIPLKDEKGLLMEIDGLHPDGDETMVTSNRGVNIVVKEAVSEDDPQILNEALNSFITSYNSIENALDGGSWEELQKYADVESFARYYLISELSANPDCAVSSFYLYKNGDGDVIHAGPIWDFDIGFGNTVGFEGHGWNPNEIYTLNIMNYSSSAYTQFFYQIMRIPEFYQLVCDIWQNTFYEASLWEIEKIDEYHEYLNESKTSDNNQWYHTDFQTEISNLKSWLSCRTDFLNTIFGKGYENAEIVQLGDSTFHLTHIKDGWYTIDTDTGVFTISETHKDVHSIGIRTYTSDYSQQWHIVEKNNKFKLLNKATGQAIEYGPRGIVASINSDSQAQLHTVIPF